MSAEEYAFVLVTAENSQEARRIADALLGARLAACVNTVNGVISRYWWQGALEEATESLLIIKTKRSCISEITTLVKSLHSYSLPEVIALPIIGGNPDYLAWINETIEPGRQPGHD